MKSITPKYGAQNGYQIKKDHFSMKKFAPIKVHYSRNCCPGSKIQMINVLELLMASRDYSNYGHDSDVQNFYLKFHH